MPDYRFIPFWNPQSDIWYSSILPMPDYRFIPFWNPQSDIWYSSILPMPDYRFILFWNPQSDIWYSSILPMPDYRFILFWNPQSDIWNSSKRAQDAAIPLTKILRVSETSPRLQSTSFNRPGKGAPVARSTNSAVALVEMVRSGVTMQRESMVRTEPEASRPGRVASANDSGFSRPGGVPRGTVP